MERIELACFVTEVSGRFQFLVDVYGMTGPESRNDLLPHVTYRLPELSVSAVLDYGDGPGRRVKVTASAKTGTGWVRAAVPGLVEAALFAPRHHVGWRAHTVAAMQRTLDDNAIWLRRLMPALVGPDGPDLLRKALEPPRRRAPNTRWQYA